jgi:hypothetical protein
MQHFIVFIGAAIVVAGSLSYAWDTLKGRTQPNRVTWLLWGLAPIIGAVAAYVDGVGWAALPVFAAGFSALMIFAASFVNPKAYWKLERFDYLCGASSVLALVLWAITKDPVIAIIFSIISDAMAAIPTFTKAWKHPETESSSAYWSGLANALTAFAAVSAWSFAEVGFAAYLVAMNVVLLYAVYRRRLPFVSR